MTSKLVTIIPNDYIGKVDDKTSGSANAKKDHPLCQLAETIFRHDDYLHA